MLKKALVFVLLSLVSFVFAQQYYGALEPQTDEYVLYIEDFDWGAGAAKVVLRHNKKIGDDELKVKDFGVDVYYERLAGDLYGNWLYNNEIKKVYVCDSFGKRIYGLSHYICIELKCSPDRKYTNPYVGIRKPKKAAPLYGLRITNIPLGIKITKRAGIVNALANTFVFSTYERQDKENLNVMYWMPEVKVEQKKIPLIVWFHGAGESGTDPYRVLLDSMAMNLVRPKVQQYFENGCAVLMVQNSTNWLYTYNRDSSGNRIMVPVNVDNKDAVTGSSYYTEDVKKIVDDFLKKHKEIDTNRIYAGGCSGGGYMVVNMSLHYPELFAAAFPICQAYPSFLIDDESLKNITRVPFWFSYSTDDKVVNSERCSIPLVKRLKENGGIAHETVYEGVIDFKGHYDEYGNPFVYNSHRVWIYVLNGWCEENGENMFHWLSLQSKH